MNKLVQRTVNKLKNIVLEMGQYHIPKLNENQISNTLAVMAEENRDFFDVFNSYLSNVRKEDYILFASDVNNFLNHYNAATLDDVAINNYDKNFNLKVSADLLEQHFEMGHVKRVDNLVEKICKYGGKTLCKDDVDKTISVMLKDDHDMFSGFESIISKLDKRDYQVVARDVANFVNHYGAAVLDNICLNNCDPQTNIGIAKDLYNERLVPHKY